MIVVAVGVAALALGVGKAVIDWRWLRRVERASGDPVALEALLGRRRRLSRARRSWSSGRAR